MLVFVFAGIPALVAIDTGVLALFRRPLDDPLLLATARAALLFDVALILQPSVHWRDLWEPFRLAEPIPLLLVVLYSYLKPKPAARRAWTLLFVCLGYTFLLKPIV